MRPRLFDYVFRSHWWLIALVCLVCLYVILGIVSVSRISTGFIARSSEADPIIEAVYLQYYETGKWPQSLETLGPPGTEMNSGEWQYVWQSDADDTPPLLSIRGPLHMRLSYSFRQGGEIGSPGGWKVTCEGDPWRWTFHERIPIRPIKKARP
ncbi:MAG: hypothetical protein JWM11_3546 [Planctomycetaceae bacterium]|nr:hypothetical protein [Planctomycetaceae bacterium]